MEANESNALALAFSEWKAGEIYVCKRTGRYRYRRGPQRLKPAPWDELARQRFSSAVELDSAAREQVVGSNSKSKKTTKRAARLARGRVDALALARRSGRKGGRK